MTEERYEADARDWLDSVDAPPPRLEVAQIVQIGRSQVRRRRLLAAGGTVAALAAVAAIPATVPLWESGGGSQVGSAPLPVLDCDVTELPLPGGMPEPDEDVIRGVSISAMDPTGRYIVGSVVAWPVTDFEELDHMQVEIDEDGDTHVLGYDATIVWESGVPTYLPELKDPQDVNTHGVILGKDWVYRDGNVEDLPVPEGYDRVYAASINDAGDVAGNALGGEDSDGLVVRTAVVRWPAAAPDQPQVLAQVETDGGSSEAVAVAVTDDGAVLGNLGSGRPEESRPYLWDASGQRMELPLPPGSVGGSVQEARGEWAVGVATVEVPTTELAPVPSASASADPASADALEVRLEPALWNLRTGTVELIDSVNNNGLLRTTDVNLAGDVVLAGPYGLHDAEEAVQSILVRGEDRFALPMPAGQTYRAQAISDDGTLIAGAGTTPNQQGGYLLAGVAVAWRC